MEEELKILLVSPDLLSTSRIAGLARSLPARVETLRSIDDEPRGGPYGLVLLDLQTIAGDPAVVVVRLRALIDAQRAASGHASPSGRTWRRSGSPRHRRPAPMRS